jgi:hypothetical protein
MAKKPVEPCSEIPARRKKDRRCKDFTPSYDVKRLGRKYGAKAYDPTPLFEVAAQISGEPFEDFSLGTTFAEMFIKAAEIPLILRAAGLPAEGSYELLARTGTFQDLVPRGDPQTLYKDQVDRCRDLEFDSEEFRRAGCKREGHVMLQKGRMGFKDLGESPNPYKTTKKTEKRWEDDLPLLDARTQSPKLRVEIREGDVIENLTSEIGSGLRAFSVLQRKGHIKQEKKEATAARRKLTRKVKSLAGVLEKLSVAEEAHLRLDTSATAVRLDRLELKVRALKREVEELQPVVEAAEMKLETKSPPTVVLPYSPAPLVKAGVPEEAAEVIAARYGGRLLFIKPKKPPSSLVGRARIFFGGALLDFRSPTEGARAGTVGADGSAWFDFSGVNLHSLRGPVRDLTKWISRAVKWKKGGRGHPRRVGKKVRRQELPLLSFRVVGPEGVVQVPVDEGESAFFEDLAAAERRPWSAVELVVGRADDARTIKLQHSVLTAPQGSGPLPDYTTLQGLSLQDFPGVVARLVTSPRKRRRGRQRTRSNPRARSNPVATYTLTAEMTEGLEPGDYRPYTPDASLEARRGKFIYNSKSKGIQVVSAKRLASWLELPLRRDLAGARRASQDLRRAEPALELVSNPSHVRKSTMAKRRRTRKNPGPLYLSSDSGLNRGSKDFYFPGTVWDYYDEGRFSPAESVPVNRRNPAKKKKKSKAPSAKQKAWQAEFKRLSAEARAWQRQKGCSLKEAWADIYAGRATANPRARAISRGMRPRNVVGANWPRRPEYADTYGPYGHDLNLPVNRRNPRKGGKSKLFAARFPGTCSLCNNPIQRGEEIGDSGMRGPQGGKKMAHSHCL